MQRVLQVPQAQQVLQAQLTQVDVSKADSSFSLELVVKVLAFGARRGQQPPLHGLAQERNWLFCET